MAFPNGRWIAQWFVCSALLGGCGEEIYRYETRLHSDGSLERAIYQPCSQTPEEAIKPVLWQAITFVEERPHESWDGPISKLPWHPDDQKARLRGGLGLVRIAGKDPRPLRETDSRWETSGSIRPTL